jgi:arylsulfatase A-like enzyme
MSPRVRTFLVDVGGVLASWIVLLVLEDVVVGLAYRRQFVSYWEMMTARMYLSPLALGVSVPVAFGVVAVGYLVAARRTRDVALLGAAGGLLLGYGITFGRHFASWAVRGPFIAASVVAAALATAAIVRRVPLSRPRVLAGAGALVAALAWLADGFVLKRLYAAFHDALFALTLAAWALTWLFVRPTRARVPIAVVAGVLAAFSAAWIPQGARGVSHADNLRRVLSDHAPILGRAVLVAMELAPPPPLEDDPAGAVTTSAFLKQGAGRTLDWSGRDIVLLTIDSLRADHLGAYGYKRNTTPNIDKLAQRGTRFERAYCPTPHTSYSVTSMMTGKYMRPLLQMNAGADSETWAGYLRKYGFRTSAFYPPAIYFIDTYRFQWMRDYGLGFEYRKEEFASPGLRRSQVKEYLAQAPTDKPLFMWVHLFEPHEPYVWHEEHPFTGNDEYDAYDSEIAMADATIGEVMAMVEARKPGAVYLFSADHGEEFGEHGGRYHGSSVYEEQARVPLIIAGPGVVAGGVVDIPVQTIDMLPTTLAALDIPLPSRLRGRDLGPMLSGKPPEDEGLAFAETNDYTMVARGTDRLICQRKIASCALYDITTDPTQQTPVSDRPERVTELKKLTSAIERENGKLEAAALPEALRRALQGDREAAEDVALLFDDVRAEIRRAAARCSFRLRAPEMTPHLKRALAKDEDEEVRRWSALALVRVNGSTGEPEGPMVEDLLGGTETRYRNAAALALAEQGDPRGEAALVARWEEAYVPNPNEPGEMDEAREILDAFVRIGARQAVPSLLRSLEDVRLRPYVVEALGAIGDPRAKVPMLALFAEERYVDIRPKEARALVALGAKPGELRPLLARFAGVPEPMPEALAIARDAELLRPDHGGLAFEEPRETVRATVRVPGRGPARLLVLGETKGAISGSVARVRVEVDDDDVLSFVDVGDPGPTVPIAITHAGGVRALWIVRRAEDVPPPAPE